MQPPAPLSEVLQPELLARAEATETVTAEHLDVEHLMSFRNAITNIRHTEIAEQTFAQIVDGLPTKSSFSELHSTSKDLGHPASTHVSLCEGVIERTRQFRTTFDILSLKFEPCTLQAYQYASQGSKAFMISLVELIAVACHQIAGFLYQLEGNTHRTDYEAWLVKEQVLFDQDDEKYKYYPLEPPAPFYHDEYCIHEQYPHGIFDMVGYWAETMIFGGVVLFDRSDSDPENKHVYLHEGRIKGPKTIYPLTPDQLNNLITFSLSEKAPTSPFPIRGTPDNRPRYDPYHAMKYFSIYRNTYERLLPSKLRRRDVFTSNDYPELDDRRRLMLHLYEVGSGEAQRDDKLVRFYEERLKLVSPSSPLWTRGGDYD